MKDCTVKKWGMYGDEPPCIHLLSLRDFLEANNLEIYSEHGVDPSGWVNIHCPQCGRTYETLLRKRYNPVCDWCDMECSEGDMEDEEE